MYTNKNQPGLVDGRRISYGDVSRDEGKRMRLAAPTVEAVASLTSQSAITSGEKPKKWRTGPCLKKWGLAKYLCSNKSNEAVNSGGKDALKSICTGEDGVDSDSRRCRRHPLNTESSLNCYHQKKYNNKINNVNNSDKIASFKDIFAKREASSRLTAKRRRITCALAKQNIEAEFVVPSVCGNDGVDTFGMYSCTEVSSSGLKLCLTKIDGNCDGSSPRKRKRDC